MLVKWGWQTQIHDNFQCGRPLRRRRTLLFEIQNKSQKRLSECPPRSTNFFHLRHFGSDFAFLRCQMCRRKRFCQRANRHKRPASGCLYTYRWRWTTGSSMFDHDLGHLCRGRNIHGHSDFGIFCNYEASSIFLGCKQILRKLLLPAQLSSLAMTSMTFTVVVKETDDPCFVNM